MRRPRCLSSISLHVLFVLVCVAIVATITLLRISSVVFLSGTAVVEKELFASELSFSKVKVTNRSDYRVFSPSSNALVAKVQTSSSPPKYLRFPDGCTFANRFEKMWVRNINAQTLLANFDRQGGADPDVRKRFMQDLFGTLNSFKVHYWIEEGTLIQSVRNMSSIPDEPPFLPFDDIDIGIRDVELSSTGTLAKSMQKLQEQGFKIIRCDRSIISLERDGDYVDMMIFASDLPDCSVREPDATEGCSTGIAPYVLKVHSRPFKFLDGVPLSFPGASLLETTEYLIGMFGVNWREHDKTDWRKPARGVMTRGKSADWAMTNRRLASKSKRFTLDRFGEVPTEDLCPRPCPYTFQSIIAEGRRLVRIDDYPFPSETPISVQREWLEQALNDLENASVPYLLGVSPHRLAFDDIDDHVAFLNNVVKNGYVCMHGFTHRTDFSTDTIDVNLWATGGEFSKYTDITELEKEWETGDSILQNINRYTREHFIPPFNAITQDMVDVLTSRGTRFIHSFDYALRERVGRKSGHPAIGPPFGGYLEDMVLPDGAVFVVSEWQKTYADASAISVTDGSQICLHWYYDAADPTYPDAYRQLGMRLRGQQNDNPSSPDSKGLPQRL